LMGNLTRDPELRYTPNGTAVCTFGMATNRTYTTVDGEKKEEADFHRLVAWRKLAEICSQYLKKGMKVFVSGRLQYREWEPQEGQKRKDAEISVDDMVILTPKAYGEVVAAAPEDVEAEPAKAGPKVEEEKEQPKGEKAPKEEPEKAAPKEEVEDDLPF